MDNQFNNNENQNQNQTQNTTPNSTQTDNSKLAQDMLNSGAQLAKNMFNDGSKAAKSAIDNKVVPFFQVSSNLVKLTYVLSVLLVISPFLPFAKIPMLGSFNLVYVDLGFKSSMGDGIFYVALGVLIFLLTYFNKGRIANVVFSSIAALMWFYHFSKFTGVAGFDDFNVSFRFGAFFLFISVFGLLAVSIMYLVKTNKERH